MRVGSAADTTIPRVIAWEVTRACPLACIHCRAEAQPWPDPRQLSTREGEALLDDIASANNRAVVILTGGEPLTRNDLCGLAAYGTSLGLTMVVSSDYGRLLSQETVQNLKAAGVRRVSFSLHYPDAERADDFARTPGFFGMAVEALVNLREGGLPFQINTTVTRHNVNSLERLHELIISFGAANWDLFFLVPTGRAHFRINDELTPEQYETTLRWLYDLQRRSLIPVKQTCAPHFRRVELQLEREPGRSAPRPSSWMAEKAQDTVAPGGSYSRRHGPTSRGCMSGNGFSFISHVGDVFGCGFLPVSVGNVRQRPFAELYRTAPLFLQLRDPSLLGGKCGICEYRTVCGGCRARAYALHQDVLAEEPYCVYQPIRRLQTE